MICMSIGTEGGNRTRTVLPPPDFESGASTSFATSAYPTKAQYIKGPQGSKLRLLGDYMGQISCHR